MKTQHDFISIHEFVFPSPQCKFKFFFEFTIAAAIFVAKVSSVAAQVVVDGCSGGKYLLDSNPSGGNPLQ